MKVLATINGYCGGGIREAGDVFEIDQDCPDLPLGMVRLADDAPAPVRQVRLSQAGEYVRLIANGRIIYPPADAMADAAGHFGDDA